ncbi:hypothetical protein [Nocardia vinacea]|uniref:hypothetical protein n=1 Tax=Nocardia vinacea TaxID=96468 RepID=UPI0012F6D072|nr:hypothetical protein [Nocardia vinacea]
MNHTARTRLGIVAAAAAIAVVFVAENGTANATTVDQEPITVLARSEGAPEQGAPTTPLAPVADAASYQLLDAVAAPMELFPIATPTPQVPVAPATATPVDAQTDINNALNQAGNEFMLGVTAGSMAGGVIGLVGGCIVGAVVGAIGGCLPGLALGAALGPIIGGAVVGIPAGIAGLIQAYNTLHDAGEISASIPAAS